MMILSLFDCWKIVTQLLNLMYEIQWSPKFLNWYQVVNIYQKVQLNPNPFNLFDQVINLYLKMR